MFSRDERERFTDILRERWSNFVDAFYERLVKLWRVGRRVGFWIQSKPLLFKGLVVVGGLLVSTLFAFLFKPIVSPESQFLLYLPAVMVGALYAGLPGGMLATLVGAAATMFLFVMPTREVMGARPEETVALLLYFMAAALILALWRAQDYQRQQVLEFARKLEDRVEDRTKELVAANAELEQFCYSISHNLRAPMRNIIGSSRMIIDDLKEKLDSEAKENLLSIGASANRLSELVDDLLHHARISHVDMKLVRTDLSKIAAEIVEEFEEQGIASRDSFEIEPDLLLVCDVELMKLALRNLLDNACKYRSPDRKLLVQIGETRRQGGPVFFVKDNGIGFDMKYKDMLFKPFERLHRDVDYPGTGIGLAIAQQVIVKHKGRIWPEAELGKGATFYFNTGKLRPNPREVTLIVSEEEDNDGEGKSWPVANPSAGSDQTPL